ncbi:MAG: hypothetical protein ACI3XL_06240 [Eubacteriales bacterium]
MKKILCLFAVILMAVCLVSCFDGEITPQIKESVGLEFTLNDDGATYSVTGLGTCADTDIVIPKAYEGKPVTGIGWRAFYDCSGLTDIHYKGTKAEWNAIEKFGDWNDYTGSYTIHCTDGDLSKE